MAGRYERTDPVSLYHHQKSHYQHIFNPRSTMRIEPENKKSLSMQRKNKSCNEKDRQRRIQNKKMLVNLLDIYNNKAGLLTRVQEQSKTKSTQRKRPFYSSYKKEQEDKQIQKNNRDLFYSILHTGPSIGTQKEWDEHYDKHCKIEKKLCNHLANDYQGLNQFRQSYTKERIRRKIGEDSAREDKDIELQQGTEVHASHKISQRKKKWMKKKAILAEKELNQTEHQREKIDMEAAI